MYHSVEVITAAPSKGWKKVYYFFDLCYIKEKMPNMSLVRAISFLLYANGTSKEVRILQIFKSITEATITLSSVMDRVMVASVMDRVMVASVMDEVMVASVMDRYVMI